MSTLNDETRCEALERLHLIGFSVQIIQSEGTKIFKDLSVDNKDYFVKKCESFISDLKFLLSSVPE